MKKLKPSLVVIAHGSAADGWSQLVEKFVTQVRNSPGMKDVFASISCAFLEHAQPRLAGTVRLCLQAGASHVLVAPLFLTTSAHLGEDVPGILGLPVEPHVTRRLKAEGHDLLIPGLPVELMDLGDWAPLLVRNVEQRLRVQCTPQPSESVVLVGYGSSLHHEKWEKLMSDVKRGLLRKGFGHAGHAYVGHAVGMSPAPTRDAIRVAAQNAGINRVHVVPLLMGISQLQHGPISAACAEAQSQEDVEILYACDSILPDAHLSTHVATCAMKSLGIFPSLEQGVLA